MAEDMTEKPTEGTTSGGRYLTRKYLVRNLQNFWNKIKDYITTQISGFAKTKDVNEALDGKADKTALEALTTEVQGKANSSALETLSQTVNSKIDESTLNNALNGKVNKDGNKVLSTNDFDDNYKTKLDNLENATIEKDGLMSAQDKTKLDELATNAVTEVDIELDETSENPVQNWVIIKALDTKADKEVAPLDPFTELETNLQFRGNSNGDIIFDFSSTPKHIKIHTEAGETIDNFYLEFKDSNNKPITFENSNLSSKNLVIPNPDSIVKEGQLYIFYIECFETSDNRKYEPFIVRLRRDNANPQNLIPYIFKDC